MISFLLTRQSDPAAMPVAQPERDDPWRLEWSEPARRWSMQFLDVGEDVSKDGLDSFLAFVAYLGCPVRVVDGGRGAPEITILDVVVPRPA